MGNGRGRGCMRITWPPGFLGFGIALLLAPAFGRSTAPLDQILQRSGDFAERFSQWLPQVNCSETVLQAKLDEKGKVVYQQKTIFDYLTLVEMNGSEFGVTESRQVRQQPRRTKDLPLLVTNGFSMMVLVFHPYYRNSFEFEQLPSETVEGQELLRVHFRHVKGTPSPSTLQLRNQEYPLDWEGTAWIDPDAWVVLRIEAGLASPMEDIGLKVLHCDVHYGPVHFSTASETYWLPQVAEIVAQTAHQHWHNLHRFANYQKFSTAVAVKPKEQP